MVFRPVTTESKELVADRQYTDIPRVGQEAGGSLDTEFSFGNMDPLLEGAFFNPWVQMPYRYNNGIADSIITDVLATVVTVTNPAVEATGQGAFAAGHLITGSGFGVAGNNITARCTAGSATSATITGFATEAVPPAQARLKVVGLEGVAGDITITFTTVFLLNTTALNFTTLGIVAGMWVRLGGAAVGTQFATAADNDWVRVSAVLSTIQLQLDRTPVGFAADTGATKTIRVWIGDYLRNGTTKRYNSIEQQYQDLAAPEFDTYAGMLGDTFDLTLAQQAIKTSKLGFIGFGATNSTTRFAGSTDVTTDYLGAVPRTGDVFNTSSNVARVAENGTPIATNFVQGLTIAMANGLRRQNAVGTLASIGIGASRCKVTGTLNTYYFSNAIRTKLLAGTATAIDTRVVDPAGIRAYVVDLPRVKLTDGTPDGIQVDSDRTLNAQFQALKDPTLGFTIQVGRFEQFA